MSVDGMCRSVGADRKACADCSKKREGSLCSALDFLKTLFPCAECEAGAKCGGVGKEEGCDTWAAGARMGDCAR